MSRPLFSLIIPTRGRPGLATTLAAVRAQAPVAAVEILVVGDTHAGTFARPLAAVPALCAKYDARYLAWDGGAHCIGQPQRQYGMAHARGQWLLWGQDDACWTPGAFAILQAALARPPRAPRLFCVETAHGGIVWREPSLTRGNCDADGCCVPNVPAKLGTWGRQYTGDFDFLQETVACWDGQLVFEPALIAVRQPAGVPA